MRFAAALLLALLVTVPAAAADVHPRSLALQQPDVPDGFRIDRSRTGVRTNAYELSRNDELATLFTRAGRVTGYSVEFRRGSSFVGSRADLLRRAGGARIFLVWYDREVRKAGLTGLERTRAGVGAESWIYWEPTTKLTLVAWRYRRVFAAVLGTDLTKEQTLALARAQQRRIAAALR